jgi:hypothetical protein
MSQQWPPQSNQPTPGDPRAPFASSGQAQAPGIDAAPTAPIGAIPPDILPTEPMAAVQGHASAPAPEQPPSWLPAERPAVKPTMPAKPISGSPPPMRSGMAYAPAGRRTMTPLIVGLLVLLVLGGGATIFALTRGGLGGGQAATTPPNANSAFTKYTDEDGVYSLNAPAAWLSTGNAALTTIGPAAQPGVRVEIERVEVALNSQQDAVAGSFFDAAASASGGSVSNKTGPTPLTLAGTTWSQYAGDLTIGSTTEHIVLLIAGHTTNTVILATIAPGASFSSNDAQYFQPMLKSFAFLK